MPVSSASRLPSKKRRASSATSGEESNAKEGAPPADGSCAEHRPDLPPGSQESAKVSAKHAINPRRLPSKKRKGSRDSSHRSVKSPSHEVDNGSSGTVVKEQPHGSETNQSNGRKNVSEKQISVQVATLNNETHERKTRRDSADSKGSASMTGKLSNEDAEAFPGRVRQRSGSLTSLDFPMKTRLRSGSPASLGSSSKRRMRSDSHASLDLGVRPRSGSVLSTADPATNNALRTGRKGSNDTTNSLKLDGLVDFPPPEPISINPRIAQPGGDGFRPRSNSTASLVHEKLSAGVVLEHLDALGEDTKPAAKKRRSSSEGDDHSSAADTFASSGHRVLMEAIKLTTAEGELGSKESSQDHGLPTRGRLGSWGGGGREHFEAFGSMLDASAFAGRGRDRLESWGGMSDLSINFNASAGGNSGDRTMPSTTAAAATAAAAAVAEQFHLAGAGEDLLGLGLFEESSRQRTASIPSRVSVGRDRLNSIASFSDHSFVPDGAEITIDLSSIVASAMAHVGDLAELAGIVETVAGVGADGQIRERSESEASSIASPMIGTLLEGDAKKPERRQRPRSSSTSSKISVNYEALAAAVDAAQAATGNIDLGRLDEGRGGDGSSLEERCRRGANGETRRRLPLKRDRTDTETSEEKSGISTAVSEHEMDNIRKRARVAASSAPSRSDEVASASSSRKKKSVPIKKRVKRHNSSPLETEEVGSMSHSGTPQASSRPNAAADVLPDIPSSLSMDRTSSKGQASQKWDLMYNALLEYVEQRRQEETSDLSEEEKKEWSWDGNVPTTYKSPDGKALGRWVNNQRSANSKGTLKEDRRERLIQAGLKWSVLASNSWNETLEELRNYIKEQTREGKEWDGNVPTHYQIKAKPNGKFAGEDKNLGRWVNRQRSLYQAGKLRKDRQLALEELGLKWSMLSSTSWEAMYETLRVYISERRSKEGSWDGNVPANYRTTDNPPRALGRWINRQRSAYTKNKLKSEYVDKLNKIGLKWSVHEKNAYGGRGVQPKPTTDSSEKNDDDEEDAAVAAKGMSVDDPVTST